MGSPTSYSPKKGGGGRGGGKGRREGGGGLPFSSEKRLEGVRLGAADRPPRARLRPVGCEGPVLLEILCLLVAGKGN